MQPIFECPFLKFSEVTNILDILNAVVGREICLCSYARGNYLCYIFKLSSVAFKVFPEICNYVHVTSASSFF